MAIGLPKDASGAIVPFSTTMMYRENGNQFHVSDLFFEARPRRWFARSGSECIETNKLYLDSKDVLVNKPKKTIPQNAAQANKGVTLSTLPEYATPNEWAEAFNVSLGDRLQDVQGRGANDREDARQHPHLPRHVLCTAGAR